MVGEHDVIDGWCAGRRALLAGAGAAGVAGLVAACGSAEGHVATPATSAAAPPGGSSAAPSGNGAGGLATTGEIPVGGGKVVHGLLIVQPVAGTFKAYSAACPHKGVLVGAPVDGVVTCPAHKSTFSMTDGHLLGGPATTGLTAVGITVDGAELRTA